MSDQKYFNFFLTQLRSVLAYSNLFPAIVDSIFVQATQNRMLMHTVLSVSSHIADRSVGRPLIRSYVHKQQAIALLQKAISSSEIEEGLIIAVFLLAWNEVASGELSARHHLQGLYLLLQKFQGQTQNTSNVTPSIMLIWRIAIRHDYLLSMFSKEPPVFPSISLNQDELHRQWIEKIVISRDPNDHSADWALAHFALDNLIHHACHLSKKCIRLRRRHNHFPELEGSLQTEISILQKAHESWISRPIVRQAELTELFAQKVPFQSEGSFLHHPPMNIKNQFYANIRSHWNSIGVYISLIAYPHITIIPARLAHAVSICRAHASLGAGNNVSSSGKVVWLFWAAVAYGPGFEAAWVENCLRGVRHVFPRLKTMARRVCEVVDSKGEFWDEFERILDTIGNGEIV